MYVAEISSREGDINGINISLLDDIIPIDPRLSGRHEPAMKIVSSDCPFVKPVYNMREYTEYRYTSPYIKIKNAVVTLF